MRQPKTIPGPPAAAAPPPASPAKVTAAKGPVTLSAYPGDAKVLLAFNLTDPAARVRLAGFTIHVQPPAGHDAYYLWNNLSFATPADHAQVKGEPAYSTANAPIHKFRWVHVPGLDHQGLDPPFGAYAYTVTPRYFDQAQHLLPLDAAAGVTVTVTLAPFDGGRVKLGFTRGFVQSQAYVRHFGNSPPAAPKGNLLFDTSAKAGTAPGGGGDYTYAQQYKWLGFTARDRVFELLAHVRDTAGAHVDVFAYDLNEPDVIALFLKLRDGGKIRIILDSADLHHDPTAPTPEDRFADLFAAGAGKANIKRGRFGRYAHDKILVLSEGGKPVRVLTGSTNFSVTGLYVNSNHVLVFDDPDVAALYAQAFQTAWDGDVAKAKFASSPLAAKPFPFAAAAGRPRFDVTFSPHPQAVAAARLGEIVDRCHAEAAAHGNVFFAVMELGGGAANPVYQALTALHADPNLFSYGISDDPDGISFYPVGTSTGVLVTGKPGRTDLPPPFNQVPAIGAGHQIHHKFVVCGFGGSDPVVYCGSSNLALAGEQVNGDNLLAIHDPAVVAAFTIEALLLIDHFNFLDSMAKAQPGTAPVPVKAPPPADKRAAAATAGWFLGTTDAWAAKFFDPADLHCRDRMLFA